jgi:DNA-binding winged helix-turn-helix (wHTH) protein/tetratricopeptide (TPR) repeat protein
MRFRFLTFELDTGQRELFNEGTPVVLSPKVFDVLAYLIEHRERMVPKTELLDRFWPANVTEASLQKTISQIRKAVAGDGHAQQIVKTYHGLGFRFVAPISHDEIPAEKPDQNKDEILPALKEQRLGTVLHVRFCDQAGNQTSGARDAALRNDFLSSAREIVGRYQGQLLHMLIDGFTAVFGLSPHYEDSARQAVHCAVALAEATGGEGDAALPLRIGIDSGPFDVADEDETSEWTLPGTVERGATILTETAADGDILLSATARGQLRDEIETRNTGDAFQLVSVIRKRAGIPARTRGRLTNFVGRAVEMAFMEAHLERLRQGTGQAILLQGPAGIGKTRLVSEFLSSVNAEDFRLVKLQCLPGLRNTPFAPLREMCLTLFSETADSATDNDIDAALLRELMDDAATGAPVLKGLSDHQRRQRSYALLSRLLQGLAREKPLLIVIEDVHWIDATSQEYLEVLSDRVDRSPLMLVMTTRPDQTFAFTDTNLQLSPLAHADSLSLVQDIVNSEDVSEQAAEALVRRAAGNPFFIEELALSARGGEDPAGTLPETVHAVIAARIGALDAGLRNLLFAVAIIAPPSPLELVAHLLEQNGEQVGDGIRQLAQLGFVHVEPEGCTFRHMLINDTAYAMVAPGERRRLHARIARYLESEDRADAPRPEVLAWHHQQAEQIDRAIPYWLAASRAAFHRSARHEVITFAENGLRLIEMDTRDNVLCELDLQLCLASALTALRGYGAREVGEAYERAQRLSKRTGSVKTDIRVRVGLWINSWVRGELESSLEHAGELLKLAEVTKDPELTLQAHASVGEVLLHKGELVSALEHLTTGLSAIGDQSPSSIPAQNAAVSCAAYAAWTASMLGQPDKATGFLDTSRKLSEAHVNPFGEAIHYALGSEPFMFLGDVDRCLDYAERAVTLSREHDFAFWLATGLVMRGWALGQLGHARDAMKSIDEGIAVFEATGAGVQLSNWYGLKAETLLIAGQTEPALAAAKTALDWAERTGDLYFAPRVHAVCSEAHRLSDNVERADWHKGQSRTLARRFSAAPSTLQLIR